ncbi:MAG: hypothetical protein OSB75_13845 [Dehalococcoidia bacterium]|nr:hypothetical protein [Dehalococcoidia bacterium]
MSDATETCLPTTQWFLYSETEEEPLGRIYQKGLPEVGGRIEEGQGFQAAEIVNFDELRATCAMRRFKVVLRLIS